MTRLWELTSDAGVRDMLAFLIARDTMHQNQWIAAIAEAEAEGLDGTPCPQTFPQELEHSAVAYQFWNCSDGVESQAGSWASGPSPDGKGEFQYVARPEPLGPEPELGQIDPRVHSTPDVPMRPIASGMNGVDR